MENTDISLDSEEVRKPSTTGSILNLTGSRKNLQRSVSYDLPVSKHRVTYKDVEFENDIDKSDKPVDNDTTIDNYYKKNHYTVTGNCQNTFQKLSLPRNISAHRFQVDKASECGSISQRTRKISEHQEEQPILEERQFENSFYWFAMHRKKFGFRYIALCLLAVLYTLLGALVFYLIEGSHELERLRIREQNLDKRLDHLALFITEAVNDPNQTYTHERMKEFIKNSYIELQKQEEQYKWSTYYRLEDPSHLKWTFSSSFFFSMNIYTTTGYGSISAQTTAGQLFTMLYAFCFVPMTLVILRDLGQMFLVNFTKLYAHGLTLVRRVRGRREIDEDELIQLPIKYCMGILIVYLFLCTTFVYLYDAVMGPAWDDGLPYFTAFYFSFISLSTIGLGDVMPNNVPYAPPVSIIFFIGMAVTKVVNRATYIAVENGVFGIMTMVETKLDSVLNKNPPKSPEVAQRRIRRRRSSDESSDNSSVSSEATVNLTMDRRRNDMMNSFTVRSIATFMRSNHDVYGGGFGRVQLRRGDLMSNAHTVVGGAYRVRPEI